MSITQFRCVVAGVAACVCALAPPMAAQSADGAPKAKTTSVTKAKPDSVTIVAGKHYKAGGFYRWLFGDTYRDLWTTPIRVPVFDWHTYAGGLHPTKEGGGNQTKSLRFENADGDEYVFRLSDKTVNSAPAAVKGTPLAGMIQDEVSAQHPAGAMMAAPLVAAGDVLHPTPVLMVMPDDSALGKFRGDFAGKLGMVEEYPNVPKKSAGFGGATKIIDSEELLKLLNTDPKEHIDARAFLTARLTDFLINDNDRHQGNWKWARLASESKTQWEPIARDRDHAFVSLDGVVMGLARLAAPTFVKFGNTPSISGLTVPRDFDARLLAGLEKPVWDSVALALQARITDSVIDAATRAMPIEYQASAPRLVSVLKNRRAKLPTLSDEFYRLLAATVAIHGTDGPDHAAITRAGDGVVEVRLESEGKQYFSRRFDARETSELLVYLHDGNDTAVVVGAVGKSILVRVIGGNGTNTLTDSSTVAGHRHPTRLYDAGTVTGVSYGADTAFDRRPWERLNDSLGPHRPDDGRSFTPDVGLSEHRGMGLVPRIGITKYTYGFSRRPYASMVQIEGEYATLSLSGRATITADHRLESSPVHFMAFARVSDFEILNFGGFGNATIDSGDASRYFEVRQRQWLFHPTIAVALGQNGDVSFGPEIQHSTTDSLPNRFVSATRPYGFGTFNQAGLQLAARYDRRISGEDVGAEHTHHRLLIEATARYLPAMMDVRSAFETTALTISAANTLPVPTQPLLVVRTGAQKVYGDFPFYEAATIGGEGTTRYMDPERYAGDASLFATSELRIPLAHFTLLLPLRAGILGLAEAGRVYDHGSSPGGWHPRLGEGIWIGRGNDSPVVTFTYTTEPDHPGIHVRFGLNF
ncbi:MAG: hypothetical protein ABJF01_12685 [bacterium]